MMKAKYIITAGLILFISGCMTIPREQLVIKRFAIEPPVYHNPADTTLNLSLKVTLFDASEIYKGDRIIYQSGAGEMNYYYYHRWIAPPEKMLYEIFTSNMLEWGLFHNGVFQHDIGIIPTHEVQGKLTNLYAQNIRGKYSAVFHYNLMVFAVSPDTFQKTLIFQKEYKITRERKNDNVFSFIQETNIITAEWINQLKDDLLPLFIAEAELYNPVSVFPPPEEY
ncbi:hypothetical protein ISS30_04440 [bacterium]|nr:hypothetical protein [FCB group bacterium]MBL7190921.1 hypothetical protein [bacterium]